MKELPRQLALLTGLSAGPFAALVTRQVEPAWVEANYATTVGPAIARAIGSFTGLFVDSVAGALIVPLALGVVIFVLHGLSAPGRGAWFGRYGPPALAIGSTGYALFVGLWGLHYRREPIAGRFGLTTDRPALEEVRELSRWLIAEAGAARAAVGEDDDGVFRLAEAPSATFAAAIDAYGAAAADQPWLGGTYARAKPLPGGALFSWAMLSGIYMPFTAEPHVNLDIPDSSIPFSTLHEMAHQRGVAREDEANFVAFYVGSQHGSAELRYSALLLGASYAVAAWSPVEPDAAAEAWDQRSPAVVRDVQARQRWREAHTSPVATVGSSVNSAYLRSNGVKDGVESYGRVVDLMVAWRRTRP